MIHRNSNGRCMVTPGRTAWPRGASSRKDSREVPKRIESATNQRCLARQDHEFRQRVRFASGRPCDRRRDALEAAVRSRGGVSRTTDRNRGERTIEQAKASEPHWQRERIIIPVGLRIGPGASWLRGYKPARQSPTYSQCSAARSYN